MSSHEIIELLPCLKLPRRAHELAGNLDAIHTLTVYFIAASFDDGAVSLSSRGWSVWNNDCCCEVGSAAQSEASPDETGSGMMVVMCHVMMELTAKKKDSVA